MTRIPDSAPSPFRAPVATLLAWLLITTGGVSAAAEPGASAETAPSPVQLKDVGFVDDDLDGVNDRFCDADGDGVDDVGGLPYVHRFAYRDRNGDERNDLFQDADGDGENDLAAALHASQAGGEAGGGSDGEADRGAVVDVIDGDADGINDILGDHGISGADIGFFDESTGKRVSFVDADGDGLNDVLWQRQPSGEASTGSRRPGPGFVDQDLDGIQDGRMLHGSSGGARGSEGGNRNRGGRE